jgi:hypothetical protein
MEFTQTACIRGRPKIRLASPKPINLVSGETVTVEPFLISPDENANVSDASAHGRDNLARKLHVSGNTAAMDQFAFGEYNHSQGRVVPATTPRARSSRVSSCRTSIATDARIASRQKWLESEQSFWIEGGKKIVRDG